MSRRVNSRPSLTDSTLAVQSGDTEAADWQGGEAAMDSYELAAHPSTAPRQSGIVHAERGYIGVVGLGDGQRGRQG
jgi:hypothetical protein